MKTSSLEVPIPQSTPPEEGEQELLLNEEEKRKQNMLQTAWFMYRCQALKSDEALDAAIAGLVLADPSLQDRVERLKNIEEKQTLILENMMKSNPANTESPWFRKHFPNEKSMPLSPEYRVVLEKFKTNSEWAVEELDRLFQENVTLH